MAIESSCSIRATSRTNEKMRNAATMNSPPKILWMVAIGTAIGLCFLLYENLFHDRDQCRIPAVPEPEPPNPVASRAHEESSQHDERNMEMGLLALARMPGDEHPGVDVFSRRYAELCRRFLPRQTPKPTMTEHSVDALDLVCFEGPLGVTFAKNTDSVLVILVESVFLEVAYAHGPTDEKELVGLDRELRVRQMEDVLSSKCDLSFSQMRASSVTDGMRRGKPLCSGQWQAVYHGYEHIDDLVRANFIWRGSSLTLWGVNNFGSKMPPPAPNIDVKPEEAIDVAGKTLKSFEAASKSGEYPLPAFGKIIDCTLAFVYRNDMYKSPDTSFGDLKKVEHKFESHLCYVVRFDGEFIVSVYVDCATGEVVGGKLGEEWVAPERGHLSPK